MHWGKCIAILTCVLGFVCLASGLAEARGNNGVCWGYWKETWDPVAQTWSYKSGSFTCRANACPPGQFCTQFRHSGQPQQASSKLCACLGSGGWQIDMVITGGHGSTYHCASSANYSAAGFVQSANCVGDCPPGTDPCKERTISNPSGLPSGPCTRMRRCLCEDDPAHGPTNPGGVVLPDADGPSDCGG
jgi:hypothetical protein